MRLGQRGDDTTGDAPSLVGRDHHLTRIDEALAEALAGSFRLVLVRGSAGVGKSRLAAEVVDRHERAAVCLAARSFRWGTTASFGPWIEALDRFLRRCSPEDVRRLCGTSLTELASLLKAVEGLPDTAVDQPPPQRWRLLEALVDLLDNLSSEHPVLVVLDDLHLADSSSWEALRYVGRRLSDAPIGVVATARPAELRAQPVATEVVVGLEQDGLLTSLDLPPLRRDEVAELARDMLGADAGTPLPAVPETLVTWLMSRSLGHPLFVVTLLGALVSEGADLTRPQLAGIPENLHDRVNLELQTLEADDREALDVLAIVDHRMDLEGLRRVLGWDLRRLAPVLARLCRSTLVAEHGAGADLDYEVAHPIIQDAVYQGIGGARRRDLHRRIARTLMEAGRAGAAAGHFARSAETGDDEAVDALCQAMGEAESRGLYQEALAILAALLDVLPAGDERWRRVLETMTWQSEWVLSHLAEGDAETAIAAMRRIEDALADSDDLAGQAAVQFHLASFLSFGTANLDEAERACELAARHFEAAAHHERALLARNELGWIRASAGDLETGLARTSEVLDAALGAGYGRAAVQASGARAYFLGLAGRFEEGEAEFRRSIELAEANRIPYRVAWGRTQLGFMLGLGGRLHEARAYVESALDDDPSAADAIAHEVLAHCAWLAGDLDAGLARVEQSAIRRPVRDSRRRAWALALAARMLIEMNQTGRARRNLEEAQRAYGGQHFMAWSFWCDWTAGVLAWREGALDEAAAALARTSVRLETIGAHAHEAPVLLDAAELAAEARDPAATSSAAARLRWVSDQVGGGLTSALADLGEAWDHLARDRDAQGAVAAETAARTLASGGYALHRASALAALGRGLEATDRIGAVEALQEAAEVYDRCGAVWRRDRVLGQLRRLGSRGRHAVAAVSGPESLSSREHEVARLAARGYTAREIGERLFIGTRTVESHLGRVYAKLGVSSKRELVRRADELTEPVP